MYLCRHLLRRRNIPNPPLTSLICQRLFSDKSHSQSDVQDGDNFSTNIESSTLDTSFRRKVSDEMLSDASETKPKRTTNTLPLHRLLPKPVVPKRRTSPEGSAERLWSAVAESNSSTAKIYEHLDAYETLRSHDVAMVNDLPASTYIRLAQDASDAGRPDVMDHLATDMVENYRGSEAHRLKIVSSLVALAAEKSLLSYARLHPLLHVLESSGSLADLSDLTVIRLTKMMIAHLSDDPKSDVSLPIVLALLDTSLSLSAPSARGAAAVHYRPPDVVQLSYYLIQRLLHVRREQQALEIFQVLVKRYNIPPEAVRETNHASADSNFIILSTLVRSCLHWGWRRSAVELCRIMLRADISPSAEVIDLTVDVLYALLEAPSVVDLGQFSYVIRELDTRAVNFELPHGLIRLFYKLAYAVNEGQSAEVLYEHTQSVDVMSRHQYPPPQGPALTWLLSHLALTSRNLYLTRQLVTYVADNYEPIPLQHRARFIAITAANGFGLQARMLWERYAVGRDRNVVLGNAAAMLRMVSVSMYNMKRTQSLLAGVIEKQEKGDTSEATQSERELYDDRFEHVSTFVRHVVMEYRLTKEPLAEATHFDLTSLARAYFILGDVSAGFESFTCLLDRKEIPDLYDINVVLSAMAEYTPRGAAKMIERMIQKGVDPDPVTFGTVIHFAAIHRDTQLVSALISKARRADNGQLTIKSVQALIRASIEMEDDVQSLVANLERALEIIQSLTKSNFLCSPRIGKYCTTASLDVHSPILAFKFWHLLVRRKVEWIDIQHKILRHRIAAQIVKQREGGRLTEDRERVMLHILRQEPKIHATK